MEKEKYLYLILDEFYNAKKLREDYINQKEFYKKINGNNDVIRNLDNNINLFNKTIEYLENLIYLPIHEMIKNMSMALSLASEGSSRVEGIKREFPCPRSSV